MADNTRRVLRPIRPLSPLLVASVLIAVTTLCTIVTHDLTSSRPWVLRADFPEDVRDVIESYCEHFRVILTNTKNN